MVFFNSSFSLLFNGTLLRFLFNRLEQKKNKTIKLIKCRNYLLARFIRNRQGKRNNERRIEIV